jgi:hypothetical protein
LNTCHVQRSGRTVSAVGCAPRGPNQAGRYKIQNDCQSRTVPQAAWARHPTQAPHFKAQKTVQTISDIHFVPSFEDADSRTLMYYYGPRHHGPKSRAFVSST